MPTHSVCSYISMNKMCNKVLQYLSKYLFLVRLVNAFQLDKCLLRTSESGIRHKKMVNIVVAIPRPSCWWLCHGHCGMSDTSTSGIYTYFELLLSNTICRKKICSMNYCSIPYMRKECVYTNLDDQDAWYTNKILTLPWHHYSLL